MRLAAAASRKNMQKKRNTKQKNYNMTCDDGPGCDTWFDDSKTWARQQLEKCVRGPKLGVARGSVALLRITVARPAPLSSIAFSAMRTTHLQVRIHAIAKSRIQIALAISRTHAHMHTRVQIHTRECARNLSLPLPLGARRRRGFSRVAARHRVTTKPGKYVFFLGFFFYLSTCSSRKSTKMPTCDNGVDNGVACRPKHRLAAAASRKMEKKSKNTHKNMNKNIKLKKLKFDLRLPQVEKWKKIQKHEYKNMNKNK